MDQKRDTLRRHLKAFGIYILLTVIFYSPVVFGGKSLLPSLYQPHGVLETGTYESSKRRPINSFNIDIATPAYYEFPINKLTGDLYKRGELPLWNPYQAVGTPLAAQYSTRVFFPYQVLEDISPVWSWDFYLLGRLVLAGLFTYFFLNLLGLSFTASVAGGAFYMLQGTFVWFINLEQLVNVAMMVPVVMYSTERLSRKTGRFGASLKEIALLGLSNGFMLLAGQPEVALYVSLLSFLYYLLRAKGAWKEDGFFKPFWKFAFSYALGLFIAMPLILPFLELVRSGYHIHPIGGEIGTQVLEHWKTVFAYLTPTFTEFPTEPDMIKGAILLVKFKENYFRFLPINGVWDTLGGYTGIGMIFLVLSGALYSAARPDFRNRALLIFFSAFGFAIIFKNAGVPPFTWIGHIPMFDQVWTLRWASPAWAFSFAAAGAMALELLCGSKGSGVAPRNILGRYFARKPQMAPALAFLALLSLYFIFALLPIIDLTVYKELYFSEKMASFVVPSMLIGAILTLMILLVAFFMTSSEIIGRERAALGLSGLVLLELWWAVPRGYDPVFLMYKLVPFTIGMIAVVFLFWRIRLAAVIAIAVFLAVSFALDIYSPYGFPERKAPFAESPYVDFLRKNLGHHRAAGAYGTLFPNFASAIGIHDIRYVNSILPASYQHFRKNHLHVDPIDEGPSSGLWFSGRPERCRAKAKTSENGNIYDFWLRPVEEDIMGKLNNYSLIGLKYLVLPLNTSYGIHESVFTFEPYRMTTLPLVYDKEVRVLANPSVLDRAYMAYSYELASSFEKAQEKAVSPGFDIKNSVMLEEDPGVSSSENGKSTSTIKGYTANSVTVEVSTDRDGILVLTDLHYPGWKAYVNEENAKVLRVNGLVRGVAVRKGKSEVVFKYRPASFMAGLAAFAVATGFSIFALVRKE